MAEGERPHLAAVASQPGTKPWHPPIRPYPPPKTVSIVAMGTSSRDYLVEASMFGGRQRVSEETWGINAIGGILQVDRTFMIDDIPGILTEAAKENPACAGMIEWARYHPGPIYTSKAYPDYPGTVEYPLEAVINHVKAPYLKNTCAFAVAFAIWLRVPFLKVYGMDFTYPNRHEAEMGRANTEFMLATHIARGGVVQVANHCTLFDTFAEMADPGSQFYGYVEKIVAEQEEGPDGTAFRIKPHVPRDTRERTLAEMQTDLMAKKEAVG